MANILQAVGKNPTFQKALELASQGAPVKEIAGSMGLSINGFYNFLDSTPGAQNAYVQAKDRSHDVLADELLSIPDAEPDVQRATLKSNNIKWLLSKRAASKYGDKLSIDVSGQVDLTAIMAESAKRLRPTHDLDIEDANLVPDKSIAYESGPLDKQSNAESVAPEDDDIFS